MKHFLISFLLFFGFASLWPLNQAFAQCPTVANVDIRTHTDISCFGANDGTITVDFNDASLGEPYNFELYDLNAGAVVIGAPEIENKTTRSVVYTNVAPGTYAVLLFKGACGYPGGALTIIEPPFGFVIDEPAPLSVTPTVIPDCGFSTGKIDIVINGGTTPYNTITWTGPTPIPDGTTSTSANLSAGTYNVSIIDANGCNFSQDINVPITTLPNAGNDALVCGTNSYGLLANAPGPGEFGVWSTTGGASFSNINDPNATVTNLDVGSNTLTWTIRDIGLVCPGNSDAVIVTYSDVLISGSPNVVLNCFGDNNGVGTFTVTGGLANYTYTLVSNTAGATIVLPAPGPTMVVSFTNASAGVVTLRVQDATGCTSETTITITQPPALTAGTSQVNVSCFGGNDGSITVTPAGGTGPYDFSIDGGATYPIVNVATHTFINLAAATYNIRVKDANDCETAVIPVTITEPASALSFGTSQTNATCFGGTDGTITVTASGGTGPYSYTLNPGGANNSTGLFTGLAADTYDVIIVDDNGCTVVALGIVVSEPSAVVVTSTSKVDATCLGVNNGSIQVNSVTGGTPGYQYSVDGGANFQVSNTFTGLAPGDYDVVARDNQGCVSAVVTVSVLSGVTFSPSVTTVDATCAGVDDGSIQINSVSGGTSPYTYSIDGGLNFQVSNSFTGLATGSYDVIARDNNGCISSTFVAVIDAGLIFDPIATPTDASCNGVDNGEIDVTGTTGGASPFEYSIDGGANFQSGSTFTGLAAGDYDVVVRDDNGCVSTTLVVNIGVGLSFDPTATSVVASCSGVNDGEIDVTGTTGGTAPFEYSIDGGANFQVSSTFTGLAAGDYDVVVRDDNGCLSTTLVVNVGVSLSFDPIATPTVASCAGVDDGEIEVTGTTGGTAPFEYSIDGGTNFQISSTFTGLSAGDYDVVVRDDNGCVSTTLVVNVGVGFSFNPTATTTVASCAGVSDGEIEVTGTTGGVAPFEYSIDGGANFQLSSTFTGLAAGDYDVVVRDDNGCISTTLTINVGAALSITTSVGKTDATCLGNDGSITINTVSGGTGPYEYSINNGLTFQLSNVFSPVSIGNYNVIVRDVNGCLSTSTPISVNLPGGCVGINCFAFTLTVDPVLTQRPSCNNQNDGVFVLNVVGSVAGNYIIQLLKPSDPLFTGLTQIGPSGTYTFSGLSPGNYEYRIQDVAGNICTQPYSLPVQTTVDADASGFVDASCFGQPSGQATITVLSGGNPPYQYSIDNGVNWIGFTSPHTINNLPPNGTYSILVRNDASDQCPDAVTVTINNLNPAITATLTASQATCNNNDGSITINTLPTGGDGGPYGYAFGLVGQEAPVALPPGNTFSNLSAGTYNLIVADNSGCSQVFTRTVTFPGFVNTAPAVVTGPDCTSGGTNGSISISILDVGSFEYTLTTDPNFVPSSSNYVAVGGTTIFIPNLNNGSYFVWVRSVGSQCPTKLGPIAVQGVFEVAFTASEQNEICFNTGGSVLLNNISGQSSVDYSYELVTSGITLTGAISFVESLNTFVIPGLPQGNYQIRLTQDQSATNGCSITTSYQGVTIIGPNGVLSISDVQNIKESYPDRPTGSMLVVITESGQEDYELKAELIQPLIPGQFYLQDFTKVSRNLTNLQMQQQLNNLYAGLYRLTLRDALGCEVILEVEVPVDTRIFIPNIFTPNGDEVNDTFFIRNLPPSGAKVIVSNRWGKQVYSSNDYKGDWDGGNESDGVYYYRLQLSANEVYTGWVEILRGVKP